MLRPTRFAAIAWLSLTGAALIHAPSPASAQLQFATPRTFTLPRPQVDLADLDGGLPDLLTQNGAAVIMRSNFGGLDFGAEQSIPLAPSGTLSAYLAADLNGDGHQDLIGLTSAALLAVRLNSGGGAFASIATMAMPAPGNGLVAADLSGDGKLDLAVCHADSGRISVWIGHGDGTFDPPAVYVVNTPPNFGYGSNRFEDIVAGRFDSDGALDLAVLDHYPRRSISVILNQGGGTFGAGIRSPSISGYGGYLTTGDLDADGLDDLVVGTEGPRIGILRALGAGSFAPIDSLVDLGIANSPHPVLADMDADGRLDLACAWSPGGWVDSDRNYLGVWHGTGTGHFDQEHELQIGKSPFDAAVADLDGDGLLDAVAATQCAAVGHGTGCSPGTPTAWILRGLGLGSFGALQTSFPDKVCSPPPSCTNLDGWSLATVRAGAPADLLVLSGSHTLWRRNRGNGGFAPPIDVLAQRCSWAPDLNGDGRDELFTSSGDSAGIVLTTGDATWAPPVWYPGARLFRFADFDGDGRLDMGVTTTDGRLHLRPGDGEGGFGPMSATGLVFPSATLVATDVGDTDGDGRAEILYSRQLTGPDSLFVIALPPGGAPDTLTVIPLPCYLSGGIQRCDYGQPRIARAGSGALPDLYVLCGSSACDCPGIVLTYRRQPDGSYAEVARFSTARDPLAINVADFNLDGRDEGILAYGNDCCNSGVVVFGAVSGGYSFYPGAYPGAGFGARIDGDSRPDLVVGLGYYGRLGFLINQTSVDPATPALLALVSLRAEPGVVRLDGYSTEGAGHVAQVERRTPATWWGAVATITGDGTGHFRWDDRNVRAGERYGYRLVTAADAPPSAESWVEVPAALDLIVGNVLPNPFNASGRVSFTLATDAAVRIDVIDVQGRRRAGRAQASAAAGAHTWPVPGAGSLETGAYVLRFDIAGHVVTRRFAVVR